MKEEEMRTLDEFQARLRCDFMLQGATTAPSRFTRNDESDSLLAVQGAGCHKSQVYN